MIDYQELFPDAIDLFYSDDEYYQEYLYTKEIESLFRIITSVHALEKVDFVVVNRLSGDAEVLLDSKGYDIERLDGGLVKISWA